ncbi:ABC transporter permease subunit, partial [Actinomadura adrarensis]
MSVHPVAVHGPREVPGRRRASGGQDRSSPRPCRVAAYVLVAFVLAMLVHSFLTNENWHWEIVAEYLFDAAVLKGLGVTIVLTLAAMVLGLILGTAVAGLRLSGSRVLSTLAGWYIWFFRGMPVIVQVIFFVYLAQLYPLAGAQVQPAGDRQDRGPVRQEAGGGGRHRPARAAAERGHARLAAQAVQGRGQARAD